MLELLRDGKLTAGHARALVTASHPEALARKVVEGDLSVRQTEQLARSVAPAPGGAARSGGRPAGKDADTRALEADLTASAATEGQHRASAGPAGG